MEQHAPILHHLPILGLLLAASAIGLLLKWRIGFHTPHALVDPLNARIKAWWLMLLVVGAALALGHVAVVCLFLLLSFFALREFLTLAPTRPDDHLALLTAFYLVLPLQYWLVAIEWYELFSIFIPVYGFLLLPILSTLGNDPRQFLVRNASVQWGLMIAVYCLSCVPALLALDIPGYEGRSLLLLTWFLLVVQSSDVLQRLCATLLGGPRSSPLPASARTEEGVIGGVLLASLLGMALFWITPFSWWQAALIALLVNLMGFAGGLVMSAIKHDRGVRDWGSMFDGNDGVLDRLDSICFAAPIFFHLVRYGWT